MVSEPSRLRLSLLQDSSLNPCFSGGWSRRGGLGRVFEAYKDVLILVLVEDGLGDMQNWEVRLYNGGLNPCFSGGWSRRGRNHQTGSAS